MLRDGRLVRRLADDRLVRRLSEDRGEDRGEADPISTIVAMVVMVILTMLLGGIVTMGIATSQLNRANATGVQALEKLIASWETEPYGATDHAVTSNPVAQNVTISGSTAKLYYSVTEDGAGVRTIHAGVARGYLSWPPKAAADCSTQLTKTTNTCVVLTGVSYPAPTDQLPQTPTGIILKTAAASRGISVAQLSLTQMSSANALDIRLEIQPKSLSAATLATWRAALVCANGQALTSSTPDSAFSTAAGGWSSARVTVANAGAACPTDTAQLDIWSTAATQPTTAQISDVHVYRVAGGAQ
ncbi:hypothetical protein GCM10022288_15900 [Gryllotalpicola kribbensis]|uniref:Type 4 fimbrial biogenesis protein PilX N-terminal domain-containing protein n=1 Tax=Gryllotalpicola kribbensis TaxID=993084 RepID=A0ABP8ARP9_9MICO